MFRKTKYLLSTVTLYLIFIVPFIYLIRFITLLSDDYCFAGSSFTEYFDGLKNWYLYINGRYFNSIIVLLPIYKIEIYRLVLALFFLLLNFAVFYFFRSLLKIYKLQLTKNSTLLLAVVSLIVFIAQLPVIQDFFYWYSAATVYEVAFIFFIFFLVCIVKYWLTGSISFYWLIVSAIVINGSSELLIGITNFLLLSLLILNVGKYKKDRFRILLVNLVSWISTLFVLMSPGTAVRSSQYNYGGNLIGSIKVAFIYGTKFIFLSITELYVILFLIFIFLFLSKNIKSCSSKLKPVFINPVILGLISYISVLSMVFIIYYATGSFVSSDVRRAGNLLKLILMLFLILNMINLQEYLKFKIPDLLKKNVFWAGSLILLLILIPLSNTNYNYLIKDYREDGLNEFKREFSVRAESIKRQTGHTLELSKIEGSKLLRSGDSYLDNQEWLQECYLQYINANYQKEFEKIIITSN